MTTTATPTTEKADQGRYNVLAIVSLVAAFVLPLIGAVLGIIALVQLRTRTQKGKGLAIAAIAVGIVLFALTIAGLAFWVNFTADYTSPAVPLG